MTTKFNKSVLAAAIAATAMLAGSASAAQLGYQTQKQITYAKDLFATDSRTIDLPGEFTVRATSSSELASVATVGAGDVVEIVISLGQGSTSGKFQSAFTLGVPAFGTAGMTEADLIANILIGEQLGGAAGGTPLDVIDPAATVNYSNGEREMRVRFIAGGAGVDTTPGTSFAFQLPTLRLYDLQGALLTGSAVNGGISITNQTDVRSILSGNALFARSLWGEVVSFTGTNPVTTSNKWIDVQRCGSNPPRIRFSVANLDPAPTVGTSCTNGAGGTWFNAGSINVAIQQRNSDGLTGAPAMSPVNNFDGVGPTVWSLAATRITYVVKGTNLAGFGNGNNLWLDTSATCSKAAGAFLPLSLNGAGTEASATHVMDAPASAALGLHYNPLTNATAAVPMNVCFGAHGGELVPQNLSATVSFDHNVPALFVNPPNSDGALYPLRLNTGLFVFQNVNPGANATAQSFMRVTNNNAVACDVVFDAKDDLGRLSDPVRTTLAPHASEQFNIDVLETGVDNRPVSRITGKFGDGTGKWYLRISPECANFTASALNRNATDGTVTDLTPAKNEVWLTPTTKLNP